MGRTQSLVYKTVTGLCGDYAQPFSTFAFPERVLHLSILLLLLKLRNRGLLTETIEMLTTSTALRFMQRNLLIQISTFFIAHPPLSVRWDLQLP